MSNFSSTSDAVFSIRIPKILNPQISFTYNYYTQDESVNEISGIPDYVIGLSGQNVPTETLSFTRKVPRFIKISWNSPDPISSNSSPSAIKISDNLDKIVTEDYMVSSKYLPYSFSNNNKIEDAFRDINKDGILDLGTSQATNIDNYNNSLVGSISQNLSVSQKAELLKQISSVVSNIEKMADRSSQTMGLGFINDEGQEIIGVSGLDKILQQSEVITTQINSLVVSDLFVSSSLPDKVLQEFNDAYTKAESFNYLSKIASDVNDQAVIPVEIENYSPASGPFVTQTKMIGYIVEKYEKTSDGFVKKESYPFDSILNNEFVDFRVKYGSTYWYGIRTVASVKSLAVYDSGLYTPSVKKITYLIASKPVFISIDCFENVPPPPPRDVYFNWDYRNNRLLINWENPYNPQRDIKQYQVFRRASINEPFELIGQKHFDKSSRLYFSGETVDGNNPGTTNEDMQLIEKSDYPITTHVDRQFKIDTETLTSSKYIYTIASIDAHGIISNYGPQYEVVFDFYKNKLIKTPVSLGEAPRQYPNLFLRKDLFKDTIKTSGESSMVMKLYFTPEYFKLINENNQTQQVVMTEQDNSYYQLQFINTQNQKSQVIKIKIDDPQSLARVI